MKLNNVKYLSLPQQVEENRKNIQKLLTEYSQVFTTQLAIQGQTSILIANLTNIEHKPVVGDLIYGSDTYYAQITRVGESVVEFTVIGQLADLDALIVDNLTSTDTNKALSANQGKVLNDTTAKLAVSNVFTQPQQVPSAVEPQHAVNKLQVETMFEMFKQQLRGYNLAMPDLAGKTDLGGGNYRLYDNNGITLDYNINNGDIVINGLVSQYVGIRFNQDFMINGTYTYSLKYISGSKNGVFMTEFYSLLTPPHDIFEIIIYTDEDYQKTETVENAVGYINLYLSPNVTFENYTIRLQLEKGSQATPYTVPGEIPQYKIVGEA